jgi:hypothetical protein
MTHKKNILKLTKAINKLENNKLKEKTDDEKLNSIFEK